MDVDPREVCRRWRARGFSCDTWSDPPGRLWRDYVHDCDELLMLLEGEMRLVVDGEERRPRPGEEVFIPAGAVHTVHNCGTTRNRWLYGYRRG